MIVLHAGYATKSANKGLVFLWAEYAQKNLKRQPGAETRIRTLSGDALHDVGKQLVPAFCAPLLTADRQTLYVPEKHDATADVDLVAMDVDVQWWSRERLQLLREHVHAAARVDTVVYGGTQMPAIIGPSLQFWLKVMDWVDLLLEREQIVPTIRQNKLLGTATFAAWRPVRTQEVHDDLRSFLRDMPLACCAPLLRPVLPGYATEDNSPDEIITQAVKTALSNVVDRYLNETVQDALGSMSPVPSHRRSPIVYRFVDSLFDGEEAMEDVMTPPSVQKLVDAIQAWSFDFNKDLLAAGSMSNPSGPAKPRLVLRLVPQTDGGASSAGQDVWHVVDDWKVEFWGKDGDGAPYPLHLLWETDDEAGAAKRMLCVRHIAQLAREMPALRPSLQRLPPRTVAVGLDELSWLFDEDEQKWLAEQGVLVEIPRPLHPAAKPEFRLTTTPVDGETFSLRSLVNFQWRVSIGGAEIDERTFRAMVAHHIPYLRYGHRWIELDAATIRALHRVWGDEAPRGSVSLADVVAAIDDVQQEADAAVHWHTPPAADSPAFRRLRDVFTGHFSWDGARPPQRLQTTLLPYQERGMAWLACMGEMGLGVCLADDMGLGKTVQVIAYLLGQKEQGRLTGPCIVVAPMAVVANWHREMTRFAPDLSTLVHHGPDRLAGGALLELLAKPDGPDVVITSYGIAQRDADTLRELSWHTVVADEAQNIKNPAAKNTRTLKSLPTRQRIALTGTPIENTLEELWSIMDFLNPGYLGSAQYFRRTFASPIERHGDKVKARRLRHMVRPFLLRRTKEDDAIAPQLPGKQEAKLYCELTPKQASLYQGVVDTMMDQIQHADGMRRRGLIFSVLTQLKQICNHPALIMNGTTAQPEDSGKMMHLLERLKYGVGPDAKALIFTQYTQMGRLLQQMLGAELDTDVMFYHGGLSRTVREDMIAMFQCDTGPRLLVLSLRAGGVGINLTRATHVFHYDRWWNPAVESQATDRAYRIGQTDEVHVHTLICQGTLEDHIDAMMEKKRALADDIIESGEQWITELATDELAHIFSLRDKAVSV